MAETGDDELDRGDWRDQGACIDAEPEIFFPRRGESTVEAKLICTVCVVRLACLEFGMSQKHGIWGGLSERQRRIERRRRAGIPENRLLRLSVTPPRSPGRMP